VEANQAERKRWNDDSWTLNWPKRERFTGEVTPFLIQALQLKPGERVLDIGCGGGIATTAAAKIVGKNGVAIGADISTPLAALATKRAAAAGAANITYFVTDVQTERVPGAPFDVAMSQFGVMFFDEPKTAFANIRAQLLAGGRLGFACWQEIAKNPWFFAAALSAILPPPPPPAPGKSATGPFAFADPNRIREILDAAGFTGIAIATHEIAVDVPEDSIVDDAQLGFMGVPSERMAEARTAVDRHMAPFRLVSGLSRFPLAFQVATARKS
jgi:SAM-dependent methyltransferase